MNENNEIQKVDSVERKRKYAFLCAKRDCMIVVNTYVRYVHCNDGSINYVIKLFLLLPFQQALILLAVCVFRFLFLFKIEFLVFICFFFLIPFLQWINSNNITLLKHHTMHTKSKSLFRAIRFVKSNAYEMFFSSFFALKANIFFRSKRICVLCRIFKYRHNAMQQINKILRRENVSRKKMRR